MALKVIHNETELLAKIAGGDQRAFKILYEEYHKKIYTFCLRQLKSVELAEDVLQESFLKVWLMGDELTRVNHIEAYLRTVARNRCYDYIRKLQRSANLVENSQTGILPEAAHNQTEEAILLADARALLVKGVTLLPPQQKRVYDLCHSRGLSFDEAAEELELSPLTVKNHMQAALRFLRRYIASNTDLAVLLILLNLF